jgi:hypothetical protein
VGITAVKNARVLLSPQQQFDIGFIFERPTAYVAVLAYYHEQIIWPESRMKG